MLENSRNVNRTLHQTSFNLIPVSPPQEHFTSNNEPHRFPSADTIFHPEILLLFFREFILFGPRLFVGRSNKLSPGTCIVFHFEFFACQVFRILANKELCSFLGWECLESQGR